MSRRLRVERIASGVHFTPRDSDGGFDEHVAPGHSFAKVFYTLPNFPNHRPYYTNASVARSGSSSYSSVTPSVSPFPPSPAPETPRTPLCLPLLKTAVEVTVDGSVASTTLTQHFTNKSEAVIPRAHYTFPLYDGAVVTAFKCSVGDDKVLIGKVQPKDDARATFKAAVEDKYAAALLEEQTPEIFETVVGNIPSMTEVEVEIKYVSELKPILLDGRKEALELVLPMSIAPRYGTPTRQNRDVFNAMSLEPEGNGLDILVKIHKDGSIEGVEPSHSSKVRWNVAVEDNVADTFGAPVASKGNPEDTQKLSQIHVHHAAPTSIMDEDFVVTIEISQAHPLCSRAVLSPTNSAGHAALLVNVKPGELFQHAARPETFDGEIIFVLDQSESMGWSTYSRNGAPARTKIETLRTAMPTVLASLPSTCTFNILSFGSTSQFLWETGSQRYTDSSRQAAIKYGGAVQANMGGTELLAALQKAAGSRSTASSSTQIILITDGEVEEDSALDYVWKTRQELKHQIRFFALGIGTRVPHRLIGRIGEFGGGYGEVVDIEAHPKWSDRLMRMLHAGIMPSSWEFDFDLGPGFERKSLVEYQFGDQEAPLATTELVPYIQAPYPTPAMHPFSYRSVFFLLNLGKRRPPSRVTLRSITPGTKTQETRELSVTPTWTDKSAILHLTTKSVLVGLDALTRGPDSDRATLEIARSNAERLGALYSITSRWTSFVAVDRARELVNEVEFHKTRLFQVSIIDALRPPTTSNTITSAAALNSRIRDNLGKFDEPILASSSLGSPYPMLGSSFEIESFGQPSWYNQSRDYVYGQQSAQGYDQQSSQQYVQQGHVGTNYRDSTDETSIQVSEEERSYEPSSSRSDSAVDDFLSCLNRDPKADDLSAKLAAFQDAGGIFHPSPRLTMALESHFCPQTLEVLVKTLVKYISSAHKLSREEQHRLIQTLMIVHYLQTHHSKDRQIWDMMASKAKHAVSYALGITGSECQLVNIQIMLKDAAMHSHFRSDFFVGDGKPPIGCCLVCENGTTLAAFKSTFKKRKEKTGVFICTYENCNPSRNRYVRWQDLWAHQVECVHLDCMFLEDALGEEI